VFVAALLKALFIVAVVVGVLAPLIIWVERKQSALIQDRIGANRAQIGGVSILGLLHPAADVIKLLSKEDVVPHGANRILHLVAPLITAIPTIVAFAVIPFGGTYEFGAISLTLVAADIDWGVLFVLAATAIAAYGALIAGWSSNSNWALLGGVRSVAQMISYEVTMGLSLVPLFMIYSTLRLTEMGAAQDDTMAAFGFLRLFGVGGGADLLGWLRIPSWGIFLNPPAFIMFLTCIMAENKRPPFDLPESDSELVAGYLTEYSGMRFGLFYLAEFIQVIVIGGLMTAVFLGGWSIPWLSQTQIIGGIAPWLGTGVATAICMLAHVLSFFAKVVAMIWLQMLIRWSLPRFRYDQVMDLCWKIILPASLINIFATAFVLILLGEAGT
jgi:NADH-quinone oxidoreductase subunit H